MSISVRYSMYASPRSIDFSWQEFCSKYRNLPCGNIGGFGQNIGHLEAYLTQSIFWKKNKLRYIARASSTLHSHLHQLFSTTFYIFSILQMYRRGRKSDEIALSRTVKIQAILCIGIFGKNSPFLEKVKLFENGAEYLANVL